MKTLDEVIKALECCLNPVDELGNCMPECPSIENCDPESIAIKTDALAYLRMYKELADDSARYAEWRENPPLTWEELCTMEGKPVWVEILFDKIDLSSRWMLVARETKAHSLPLAYTDDIGHWIFGHEDNLGKTWQAYKRERE